MGEQKGDNWFSFAVHLFMVRSEISRDIYEISSAAIYATQWHLIRVRFFYVLTNAAYYEQSRA